jgi:hypothetical protein
MSILNKDNNGYITPEEFNSFGKQAQLEIFNQYFVDFKNSKLEDFKGMESSGYSDITKQIDQTIDYFSKNYFIHQKKYMKKRLNYQSIKIWE